MTMEQTRVRLANGIELDVVDEGPKDAPALIFRPGATINPVLGFVFFAAVLSLIIYLIVDLIYFAIDPRVRG